MQEEELPRNPLEDKKIEVKAEPTLQIKQEPKMPSQGDEEMKNTMQKIKEQNQNLFQAALGERKSMNMARFNQYMKKRQKSFTERSKIFTILRNKFQDKQKFTRSFLKSLTKFFQEYVTLYHGLKKGVSKFDLSRKYKTQISYEGVKQSIVELISLNQKEFEHVEQFIDWLEKVLIEGMKSSDNYFKERMKKLNKQIDRISSEYNSVYEKQNKAYEKMTQGNDLLEKEIFLMEKIKITNEESIKRMKIMFQNWQLLIKEEQDLKKMMSQNILQFHDRLTKFHKRSPNKTDGAHGIFKYWSKLPASPSVYTIFTSIIDPKDCEYMAFGCKSKKLEDCFQDFMNMTFQQKRNGDPLPFLDILIVKKFRGKIQQNQREWKQIQLIFTVDHNLIFRQENQAQISLKVKDQGLQLGRPSQNILQITGLEEGKIFDSTRKRMVHFETLDEVQQFSYYVKSIPDQKVK